MRAPRRQYVKQFTYHGQPLYDAIGMASGRSATACAGRLFQGERAVTAAVCEYQNAVRTPE